MTSNPELALQALVHCDIAGLDVAGTIEASRQTRLVRGYIDAFEAGLSARISELHESGSGAPTVETLTRNQGISAKEAKRRERRSKLLAKAKAFGKALANGDVAAEHTDVLASITSTLDTKIKDSLLAREDELLSIATNSSPEEFRRHTNQILQRIQHDHGIERAERQKAETRVSRRIDSNGMHHLTAVFHPEMGTAIWAALDRHVDALHATNTHPGADRQQLAAHALAGFVIAGHQQVRPVEAEISVIIDADTLCGDLHEDSVCEYDSGVVLPPETVRRLCCQGRIIPIVIGANGVPLDMGREIRLANRAQRRALRAIYRCCAFAGCDVRFNDCEIHHVLPFELGGATDLINLLPLCSRHHHLVHEAGWGLELDPDRTLTIRQPDGAVYATVPIQIDSRPRNRHRRQTIDDETERIRQPVHQSATAPTHV